MVEFSIRFRHILQLLVGEVVASEQFYVVSFHINEIFMLRLLNTIDIVELVHQVPELVLVLIIKLAQLGLEVRSDLTWDEATGGERMEPTRALVHTWAGLQKWACGRVELALVGSRAWKRGLRWLGICVWLFLWRLWGRHIN